MGDDILKICPTCGAETTRKFCTHCGTRMDQESANNNVQNTEEISKQDFTQREEEEKARLAKQREEEEKARLAKQREEEEKARLAKQREEEEKARLAKQKEEEEKARLAKQKEEEEKARLAKQKEEEEKARLAKQREEEEKARLAKQREDEEKRKIALQKEKEEEERKEQIRKSLQEKKKYEEAVSYMDHASQTEDKKVAANFYRKAETLFEQVIGWEDAEDKILECARKAKACEIAVESERIAQGKQEDLHPDIQNSGEAAVEISEKKNAAVKEKKPVEGKPKSKILIVAAMIGVLVIGGAIFALTRGNAGSDPGTNNESETSTSSDGGEMYAGDLIAIDGGPELTWDTGSAVLTHYQFEKNEYDGDCVNLYFDYSKTGGEDGTFSDAFNVAVFQNGYALDQKTTTTTEAENKAFDQVKSGASITAANGFILNDSSELTVVLTAYDKDYNKIVERTKITIPDDQAKEISGNKKYFEETGEKPVKDGISIKSNTGEVKITGYKWTEYEGDEMLVLYFDYTNLSDDEQSMSESDINVTVFQDGVEQDSSGWSTSEAESHYFSRVQKGTTMHCGYSYSIPEKSEIEVKLTCWLDDNEVTEEQVINVK